MGPVDAIVDMARTAVNATGTTVSSLLVGVWEKEFDREAFNDTGGALSGVGESKSKFPSAPVRYRW
jgi:Na+/H+-dicarboxylate symporter